MACHSLVGETHGTSGQCVSFSLIDAGSIFFFFPSFIYLSTQLETTFCTCSHASKHFYFLRTMAICVPRAFLTHALNLTQANSLIDIHTYHPPPPAHLPTHPQIPTSTLPPPHTPTHTHPPTHTHTLTTIQAASSPGAPPIGPTFASCCWAEDPSHSS